MLTSGGRLFYIVKINNIYIFIYKFVYYRSNKGKRIVSLPHPTRFQVSEDLSVILSSKVVRFNDRIARPSCDGIQHHLLFVNRRSFKLLYKKKTRLSEYDARFRQPVNVTRYLYLQQKRIESIIRIHGFSRFYVNIMIFLSKISFSDAWWRIGTEGKKMKDHLCFRLVENVCMPPSSETMQSGYGSGLGIHRFIKNFSEIHQH